MWIIEVYNSSGDLIAVLQNTQGASLTLRLNKIHSFDFRLSLNDPAVTSELLQAGKNEIKVKYGNRYLFGGIILGYTVTGSGSESAVSVFCQSYEWLLTKRMLEMADSSVSTGYNTGIGEIISGLIDETQSKQTLNLTEGTIETTPTKERNYKQFDIIYQLITNLCNLSDGVDFEITPDKVWNVYSYKGGQNQNFEFEYSSDGGNILEYEVEVNAQSLATRVFVKGSGNDDAAPVVTCNDATQEGLYNRLEEQRGYSSDVENTLTEYGNGILEVLKKPIVSLRKIKFVENALSTPTPANLMIGDSFRIIIKDGDLIDIDEFYRVEIVTYDIESETITLEVSNEN